MLMNKKRLLSSVLLVSILTANVKANHYSFDKNTTDDTETVFNKCCYIIMGTYNNGKDDNTTISNRPHHTPYQIPTFSVYFTCGFADLSLYIYRNGELIHSINDISIEADEYLNVSLPNFDNDTYNIIIKDCMKIILDENINI